MAQKPIDGTQLDNTTVDAATLGGLSVGAGANNIVQRDGSGNLDADTIGTFSVGTGANNIVQLNGSSQLPAVDGSLLTSIFATATLVAPFATTLTETEIEWTHGLGTDDIDFGFTATGSVDTIVSIAAISAAGYILVSKSSIFNNNFIAEPTAPTTGKIKFRFKNVGTDQTATIRAWARKR